MGDGRMDYTSFYFRPGTAPTVFPTPHPLLPTRYGCAPVSISLSSLGAREIHSTPLSVTM